MSALKPSKRIPRTLAAQCRAAGIRWWGRTSAAALRQVLARVQAAGPAGNQRSNSLTKRGTT